MEKILNEFAPNAPGLETVLNACEWQEIDSWDWGERFTNLYDVFPAFVQAGYRATDDKILSGVMYRLPSGEMGHFGSRLNPYRSEVSHLFVPRSAEAES